jgi:hypothetical protein
MAALACGLTKFRVFWFVVIDEGEAVGYASSKAVADVADAIDAYRSRDSKRKGKRR